MVVTDVAEMSQTGLNRGGWPYTSPYLLTGDDTSSYDANVVQARTLTIPVIKLQMLEDVLLEKISLEEMIRLGLENEQLE